MPCVDCNCGRAAVCDQFESKPAEAEGDKLVAEAELRSFADATKSRPQGFYLLRALSSDDKQVVMVALTQEGAAALQSGLAATGHTMFTVTHYDSAIPEVGGIAGALSTYFSD